jgi:hypothetical protein
MAMVAERSALVKRSGVADGRPCGTPAWWQPCRSSTLKIDRAEEKLPATAKA